MSSRPAVGTTVQYNGYEYVIVRYPTHNLDTLEGMVMARRTDQKRSTRLWLKDIAA